MSDKQTRTERLEIRIDAEEGEAFLNAAEASGMSLSAWVRQRLRRAAKQDLEEAGRRVSFSKAR
jgi:uncharacterized protein (DUF1778 family)